MKLSFAHFDVDQAPQWLDAAAAWTTVAERQTASLRTGVHAQAQYLVGRAALRVMAAGYGEAGDRSLQIAIDPEGKPFLPTFPDLHISIAHCPGYVATTVCDGAPVGVDVEVPGGSAEQALAVAARMFDASEAKLLAATDAARILDDFWHYWTCKEATGKACGVGLARAMRSAVIDLSGAQPRLHAVGFGPKAQQWSLFQPRFEVSARREHAGEPAAPEVVCAVAVASPGVKPVRPRQLKLSELQ